MDRNSGYLFSSDDLRELIEIRRRELHAEVEAMEANRLLNTSPADLIQYVVEKYQFHAPVLRRDAWSASEQEAQVDVRYDSNGFIRDKSGPCLVPGQRIEIEVPIEGDAQLLYARASSFTSGPPRAEVRGGSVFITFNIPHDAKGRDIKAEAERILDEIDRHLGWTRDDINGFNQGIAGEAERAVTSRRERILANQGRAATLGIPLKGRANAPRTYAVPDVRRKVVPALPSATSAAYEPEPTLDMENYEHIISVMQNMAHVMERSPSAFESMGEEDLRQHFLVQLNGQFEGAATGETFNVNGKTDILLRANGRNVFIAECKFWTGPKHYRETIDQLLGYTAWRDTKTAVLVFNRGTSMSTVLAGVQSETSAHKNYKRSVAWKHESGFRYVFHHTADTNREFILTVMVFDVPGRAKPAP
jgi:hypothetical protein